MAIKVSSLLEHNTVVEDDLTPKLGGQLDTNNFSIVNGTDSVVITGNGYPIDPGVSGQVLSTDGMGVLSWITPAIGATITLTGDVTGSGYPSISTTISPSGVVANTYGSASTVGVFTVNAKGQITSATNAPIAITPSQAGLGNVTNSLQVINNGGAPSIQESVGAPTNPDNPGALYVDQNVTNGNSIYRYNGTSWDVIATKPNLYVENSSSFIVPQSLGNNSISLGSGANTASTAPGSLAIGLQSLARNQGGVVQASGRFASTGDAQAGRYLLRGTTISQFPQELLIDGTGGSVRLSLPDDATWTFKVTVTGHRTDLGDGHAGYVASGVIYRGSGAATTAIQGSVQKSVLAESNPVWDINIAADIINGSLKVTVTGEASKTIRWVALVETVEITN